MTFIATGKTNSRWFTCVTCHTGIQSLSWNIALEYNITKIKFFENRSLWLGIQALMIMLEEIIKQGAKICFIKNSLVVVYVSGGPTGIQSVIIQLQKCWTRLENCNFVLSQFEKYHTLKVWFARYFLKGRKLTNIVHVWWCSSMITHI